MAGTPLGPMTRFLLCSSSLGALSDDRMGLQFVVQSVSGQSRGGLITIHYSPVWGYWVPFPSPLTTRRDYGGSTRLHTWRVTRSKLLYDWQSVLVSSTLVGLVTRYYFLSECCCLKFGSCFYGAPSLTRGRVCSLQCNHSMVRVAQNP
jgi:hypothetical protein